MKGLLLEIADAVQHAVEAFQGDPAEVVGRGADGAPSARIDRLAEETVLRVLDYEGAALNVLSEEAGFIDRGGKATLVLDPIDGTHNAIRGIPAYSVSLAIGHERLSDVQQALVRDLVSGATYYAAKGGGALLNARPIRVRLGSRRPSDLGGTFMRFGITANPRIPSAMECATQVLAKLESKQEVLLESDLARALDRKGVPLAHMKADVMLAIGGDGTILRALQLSDSKVLGINSGSLGFLAEVNSDDMDRYLDQTIRGDYRVEERMRLKVTVDGERLFDCTNEAVVHTAQIAKIRTFEICLDDQVVERIRADGMIVATPTGSTSYSMSAGGPIVDPHVDAMIVTAIAPFKPASRPHVFPAASQVHVRLMKPKECLLVMDGQHESSLKGTEDVVLTASERRAKFIRFRNDFYRRVEEKLSRQ